MAADENPPTVRDPAAPEQTLISGIPERDTVVTFTQHFASYNEGESAAFTPDEAAKLVEDGVGVMGGGPNDPPINLHIPYVSQVGNTLDCTMGEWTGDPTSYAYQFQKDGAAVGDGTVPLPLAAEDVGASFTCVVTATNAAGSTAAPPSNAVVVTEPATTVEAASATRSRGRRSS